MGNYDVMRALNDQKESHFARLQEQYARYYEAMARDMLSLYQFNATTRTFELPKPADPYLANRQREEWVNSYPGGNDPLDQRVSAAQVRDDYDGPESLPNWED